MPECAAPLARRRDARSARRAGRFVRIDSTGADALKRDLLAHLQEQAVYRELWSALESRLRADLESEDSALREQATRVLIGVGEGLLLDAALRDKLNGWLIRTIEDVMLRHGHQISLLIAEVVREWDAGEVAQKIESEIGKDLQFIRINGTIVGGLVGVLIHAVSLVVG